MYVCVSAYMYVCIEWVCVDKPDHEMEIFVDGDMDGCLHDELW